MENLVKRIKEMIPVENFKKQNSMLCFFTVQEQHIELILSYLKNNEGYTDLIFLQAVDYLEENKFMMTYMLNNLERGMNLGINVFIDREKAEMTSIHRLWSHVWQFQREIHELYGINFPGSPRVTEPFVLEGWEEMPPMRRDFDTMEYVERTFYPRDGRETSDPKKHMKEKLYKNYTEVPKIRREND